MDTARATWMLACSWGKCSTAQPRSTPTHDRHTQGSHWYVGGGHARDAHGHGHARARHGHARARSGHARAPQSARPSGHRHTHANPGRSTDPGVSILRVSVLHSPTIMPLVVGCLVEARVSEPGPGTRTLLLHVPVMKYIWGVMRQYVNNICLDIIEQISCLSFSCESLLGKILSYIFWGCMLGLMSAELTRLESRSLFLRVVRNRSTTGIFTS